MIVWTERGIEYSAYEQRRTHRWALPAGEIRRARIACACIGAACAGLGVLVGLALGCA